MFMQFDLFVSPRDIYYKTKGCTIFVDSRLQVVSNFGDADFRAGEIHARAREISRRQDASACVFRPPHNRHRQN